MKCRDCNAFNVCCRGGGQEPCKNFVPRLYLTPAEWETKSEEPLGGDAAVWYRFTPDYFPLNKNYSKWEISRYENVQFYKANAVQILVPPQPYPPPENYVKEEIK